MTDVFRSTLADQAYVSIKRKLSELDLMPVDRLAEEELAVQQQDATASGPAAIAV